MVKSFTKTLGSIRLAIALLIMITVVSVLGVLIPQGLAPEQYLHKWGAIPGRLLLLAGIDHIFSTFWFSGLLAALSLNIVVCSITRLARSIRSDFKPHFLQSVDAADQLQGAQKLKSIDNLDITANRVKSSLRRRFYHVFIRKESNGVQIFAIKGIGKDIGSLIFHLSLVLLMIGGIVGRLKGMAYEVNMKANDIVAIRGYPLLLRCEWFKLEAHEDGEIADYKSKLTLLDADSSEIASKTIEVNDPLTHKDLRFYQSSYGLSEDGADSVELYVENHSKDSAHAVVSVVPGQPRPIWDSSATVQVVRFLPDFVIDMTTREATSRSSQPNNPAAKVVLTRGADTLYSHWVFLKHPGMHAPDGDFQVNLKSFTPSYFSGIRIRKHPGVPLIWAAIVLMSHGLCMVFYIRKRRVWVSLRSDNQQVSVTVSAGASETGNIAARIAAALNTTESSSKT